MAPKTIILKTSDGGIIRKERVAAAAITPGDLIELTSADEVQRHSGAAGAAARAFAIENDLVGDGIDDDYDDGDTVQYGLFRSGEEVYALLAYGQNVAIGAKLASASAGKLQAHTGDATASLVAIALEAVNANTDGAERIKVEVV